MPGACMETNAPVKMLDMYFFSLHLIKLDAGIFPPPPNLPLLYE